MIFDSGVSIPKSERFFSVSEEWEQLSFFVQNGEYFCLDVQILFRKRSG